ncbi:hypothetical protein RESH_05109 [Rhodopirellula europaea SH398]|uniref:Uncharacterized protein n=1 Tax=Rhodopirellula europaea SH398 TaxID=1263868 RepID=M5SDS3_9BACT|nr:hypothetical protein RESH_05109 [Rhodopirellula europaea SH398]
MISLALAAVPFENTDQHTNGSTVENGMQQESSLNVVNSEAIQSCPAQ